MYLQPWIKGPPLRSDRFLTKPVPLPQDCKIYKAHACIYEFGVWTLGL